MVAKEVSADPQRPMKPNFEIFVQYFSMGVLCLIHLHGQKIFCPGQNFFVRDKIFFVQDKKILSGTKYFGHQLKVHFYS